MYVGVHTKMQADIQLDKSTTSKREEKKRERETEKKREKERERQKKSSIFFCVERRRIFFLSLVCM